jgi:hypothetical protein
MAGLNFIRRSRPKERFPLSFRLRAWQSGSRYTPAGRYLRALRKGDPWGLLMAAFGTAAGALPFALYPDVVGSAPGVWTAIVSAAGLVGLVMIALDVTLAWLVDPDWMKLHCLVAMSPLVVGISLQIGIHSVPLVFGDADLGLLQAVLGVSVSMASLAAGLALVIYGLDGIEGLIARRQAQRRIFNPFDGTWCRDLSDGE